MAENFIQSRANPRVKTLIKLKDRSGRKKLGLFLVEGLRELSRCAERNLDLEEVYFCPAFYKSGRHAEFVEKLRSGGKIPLCELAESVFEKVSNREGCDGLLGVCRQWATPLSDITLNSADPVVLVADAIEKPGNLGALIRTADSLGAEALILTNLVSDIFNPAVVRASQGALFSLPIAVSTPDEAARWLKARGIKIYAAHLAATKTLQECPFEGGTAVLVGSESSGLGEDWSALVDERLIIPMSGISDSLNVNVAAALFVYAARAAKLRRAKNI